ncbi:MAG: hypothetical protein J6S76_02575 [Clostridia bacterium]|nr:hypothetical protein [Clostridia bacterium]
MNKAEEKAGFTNRNFKKELEVFVSIWYNIKKETLTDVLFPALFVILVAEF